MIPDNERLQIRQELEQLREHGAHRQELSLHACKRLFFDFGVRPSMSTVRDLTRTGSASDIPRDIELFWQRLRTASKVRIGAGAIPALLEEKAGELMGQMFDMALAQAHQSLSRDREESQQMLEKADRSAHDAEILRAAANELSQRSEARAQEALNRARELEAQLTVSKTQSSALQKRLDAEQASNATLHGRIDALHQELRSNTEHYAQQIKDALTQAERRVKPMLVELDSLRLQAAAWQTRQRDAGRGESGLAEQLAVAQARNSQLDAVLRERMDEIEVLSRQIAIFRAQQGMNPVVTEVLRSLALAGRFRDEDFARIGTLLDDQVALPAHCSRCGDGEPELSQAGGRPEIFCPECGHSSGPCPSRLKAVSCFMGVGGSASAIPD